MFDKKRIFGIAATLIVYSGFVVVPDYPIIGIPLLLLSNFLWCYRFATNEGPDWEAFLWQASFVAINIRWLLIEVNIL